MSFLHRVLQFCCTYSDVVVVAAPLMMTTTSIRPGGRNPLHPLQPSARGTGTPNVVDPSTLNLDPDPEIWPNLDPEQGSTTRK